MMTMVMMMNDFTFVIVIFEMDQDCRLYSMNSHRSVVAYTLLA